MQTGRSTLKKTEMGLRLCSPYARHICYSSHQEASAHVLSTSQRQLQEPSVRVADLHALEGAYRRGVGICLLNSSGKVFAAQRCDDDANTWQMPQGGINDGEDAVTTAIRELQEETSISSVEVVASASCWLKYDYPFTYKCSVRQHYIDFDGQVQQWFLMRFTGQDSDINLDTPHQEFKAWKWMSLEELPDAVIDFKQDMYREVVNEFLPHLHALTRGP